VLGAQDGPVGRGSGYASRSCEAGPSPSPSWGHLPRLALTPPITALLPLRATAPTPAAGARSGSFRLRFSFVRGWASTILPELPPPPMSVWPVIGPAPRQGFRLAHHPTSHAPALHRTAHTPEPRGPGAPVTKAPPPAQPRFVPYRGMKHRQIATPLLRRWLGVCLAHHCKRQHALCRR